MYGNDGNKPCLSFGSHGLKPIKKCGGKIMSNSLEKMTKDVLSLPLKDRAKLAHKLITSLDEHVDSDVNTAWETEINRRVKDIKDGIAI
ncbi:MAG: hypothetical protein CV087_18565 [Candidatus Brocadia sp. WS118]|nr:MAG: hypothetical protein CV087_18565 [Candidatus Brocadia sp. WS118]